MCDEKGSVKVYLNNTKIDTAYGKTVSQIVEFDYNDGDELKLVEPKLIDGIILFNSFEVLKCSTPTGHKNVTVFDGNLGYNLSFAKNTCRLACDDRDDCRFAELYYAGTENQSCILHGNSCIDWRSSPHPLTTVYVKSMQPKYIQGPPYILIRPPNVH